MSETQVANQTFNDDLMLSERDRDLARTSFPTLFPILDFPELRLLFQKYDLQANHARKLRQGAGVVAIILGVISLLAASAEPLYEGLDVRQLALIGGFAAACGIGSVAIGAAGVFDNRLKGQWLCGRLMTERLRQFYFQLLVSHGPEILAGSGNIDRLSRTLSLRRQLFARFRIAHEGRMEGILQEVIADHEEEAFWLLEDDESATPGAANLAEYFAAYRLLRIEHQIQYANFKLRREGRGSLMQKLKALSWISISAIATVLGLHLIIALALMPAFSSWFAFAGSPAMHVGIVWTAIAALAARALEEGLQPARDVERYTRYRSVLARFLFHYDRSDEPGEKRRIMREVERVVYQEMRSFLVTTYDSRFIL